MIPLTYRSVLREDKSARRVFASWLNELRNLSGAYVIRSRRTHETLYIGESHSGRLAATIKRHFYAWKDSEERQHFTADPATVEVAVRVTPPAGAVGAQNNLIARLDPRENVQGKEDVPF